MKVASLLCVVLFLNGCSSFDVLKTKGADIADQSLDTYVWGVCLASSVGSVVRRYGTSPDGAAAYELFCEQEWNMGTVTLPIGGSNGEVQ